MGKKGAKKAKGSNEDKELKSLIGSIPTQEEKTAGKFEACDRMGPRSALSMSILPTTNDLVFFGGEFFNGKRSELYNDVYKYHPTKQSWKILRTKAKPYSRCSHQTIIFSGKLYLYGGEVIKEERSAHFRDLWTLDLKEGAWEMQKPSGMAPSARSGHRMAVCRGYGVLFGGFYDTGKETRYHNDLWLLNLTSMQWTRVAPSGIGPSERSSVSLLVSPGDSEVVIFGGFAKVRDTSRVVEGKTYRDLWKVDAKNLFPEEAKGEKDAKVATSVPFEEQITKGLDPARSGAGVAFRKRQLVAFGGVHDVVQAPKVKVSMPPPRKGKGKAPPPDSESEDDENMKSYFYNDLHSLSLGHKQWSVVTPAVKGETQEPTKDEQSKENEALENQEKTQLETKTTDVQSEAQPDVEAPPADAAPEVASATSTPTAGAPVASTATVGLPLPRCGAQFVPYGKGFLLYGGTADSGKKELCLDDCWLLEYGVGDRPVWKNILHGTFEDQEWIDSSDDEDDEDEDGEEEDDEEEDEEEEDEEEEDEEEEDEEEE